MPKIGNAKGQEGDNGAVTFTVDGITEIQELLETAIIQAQELSDEKKEYGIAIKVDGSSVKVSVEKVKKL